MPKNKNKNKNKNKKNKCFVPIMSHSRKDDIHEAEIIGVFSSKKKVSS